MDRHLAREKPDPRTYPARYPVGFLINLDCPNPAQSENVGHQVQGSIPVYPEQVVSHHPVSASVYVVLQVRSPHSQFHKHRGETAFSFRAVLSAVASPKENRRGGEKSSRGEFGCKEDSIGEVVMVTYENLAAPTTEIVYVIPRKRSGGRLKSFSARLSAMITLRTMFSLISPHRMHTAGTDGPSHFPETGRSEPTVALTIVK